MEAQDAVDITRHALMISMLICSPVLIVGMVVGLLIGLLQAVTQVQEQTVAFVPKLVAMILALSFTLPWLIGQMVDYTRELFEGIPGAM